MKEPMSIHSNTKNQNSKPLNKCHHHSSMSQELHIFPLYFLLKNNNHERNIIHLMIDMKTEVMNMTKEVDINNDIKVVKESSNHNSLIVVTFPIDNMTIHILKYFKDVNFIR